MESLTLTLFVSIVTACPRPIHFSLGLTTGILWYLFWRIFTHYHSCIFHSCIFHPCDLLPHFPHPHFQRPLYTCSMSARHQCEASTWRHDAHFATVVRGCCCGCRCRFRVPTPLKLALLAQAPACSRLRPGCCCCCCCCPPAAVGTPYERRQNGWLHAETTGDYRPKRLCRIMTNRI